jgi:uncharacterized membrane protein YkoI
MFQFLSILFIVLLPFSSIHAAKLADDVEPGDGVNEIQLPLTKESAAELIRVETRGKVLSVEKKPYKNSVVFNVKVLHDDGIVKVYRLDPNTGHRAH